MHTYDALKSVYLSAEVLWDAIKILVRKVKDRHIVGHRLIL